VIQGDFLDFRRIRGVLLSIFDDKVFFSRSCLTIILIRASFLLMSGGIIFDRTGSHPKGVDFNAPFITRIALFNCVSIFLACWLFNETSEQYLAVEYTSVKEAVLSLRASETLNPVPPNFSKFILDLTFFCVFSKCFLNVKEPLLLLKVHSKLKKPLTVISKAT